jgi:hypothetical protein
MSEAPNNDSQKTGGEEEVHVRFESDTKPGRHTVKLAVQDISKLDAAKLTPLTPEVISRQATINIGTIGHVAHGKSTVVKAISGVQTVRFKNELIRNITIKLGYANAKIYKCDGARNEPGCYKSKGSSTEDEFTEDGKTWRLQRHVSFVDCPGHDILMAVVEVSDQRSAEPTPPVERDFDNLPRMLMEEDKSWRCDLHPAWNRDFTAVTINARPTGGDRQVVLLTLGSDLSVYFQ